MADKKAINGFIAVRMPTSVRKRLESVSKALREAGVSGEWQQDGTHHLTLKYIGKIESEKYDAIAEALREPCRALSLPVFTVGPLFTFEAHNGNTVLAARVTPKDDLERLFRVLERVAVENGAEKSKFPSFKPHVTLCYLDDKEDWKRAKAEIDLPDEFGELTISTVPLNESAKGQDFKIRRTVRVGRSQAFHDVWAAIAPAQPRGGQKVTLSASSRLSAKVTEAICPHCGGKKEHQCAKCGQGVMSHGDINEADDGKTYCGDCWNNTFAWCDSCQNEVRKDADGSVEIDADWFCKDCQPPTCDNCSKDVHPDEAQECDGQTFCEKCYDKNCVNCAECTNAILKEDAIDAFDMWFCEDHRPTSCDSCVEYISDNEINYTDNGIYCSDCYESVVKQMAEDQWIDFYTSHHQGLKKINVLQKAVEEDEDGMTPDIYARIFADMDWDSSYGGKAWAHIAETWRDLAWAKESNDWTMILVLTDHAFDLAHNSGSLFTKTKPEVQKWLYKALEEKYFRDPLEYRNKLSADVRKLLDAHIRHNAGGLAEWKRQMDGKAGAMKKMEMAIAACDEPMAKRIWAAFDLSAPMFKGRDSFLEVAFWSEDERSGKSFHGYNGYFIVGDIREFMRVGDSEKLAKIMTVLPPDKCKPGSSHPAASYLWDKFMPKVIDVVDSTPGMLEKMRKSPPWYKPVMNGWVEFIQSAKRRQMEDAKEEKSLATALSAAFLKVALNQTDFYDFYALTVVGCDGLPNDMVRLCRGLKKVMLIRVSDAIVDILRRAVVREARHVQLHVGTDQ